MAELPVHKERRDKLEGAMEAIENLSPEVRAIPEIKKSIDDIRSQIDDLKWKVQEDEYDRLKKPVESALKELSKDILKAKETLAKNATESANRDKIHVIENDLNSLPPDFVTDIRVKSIIDTIRAIFWQLNSDISLFDSKKSEVNTLLAQIRLLKPQFDFLVERKNDFETNKEVAKKYLAGKDIKSINDLCDIFRIGKWKVDDLVVIFAQMMLEWDGLTPTHIFNFYVKFKDVDKKTAQEKDIQKWVEEIKNQDTYDKVKGTKVIGTMPPDMERAIETELLWPNILKMMSVASEKYQKEMNAYLKWEDTGESLNELGFTDHDWFSLNDDAGEELKLTNQQQKLVFLEAYTTLLAAIIKAGNKPAAIPGILDKISDYIPSSSMLWWIGGGALIGSALLAIFYKIFANTPFSRAVDLWWMATKISGRALKEFLIRIESNFEGNMDAKTGPLNADTRNYILGNIQLIHARMNLSEGEIVIFEGDEYGRLTVKEGEKRIRAIKAAVWSAEIVKRRRPGDTEKEPKKKSSRFVISQVDPTNELASKDSQINLRLIQYIQDMSRSPSNGLGMILRPNTRYLEQDLWKFLAWDAIRAAELAVPIAAASLISPLAWFPGLFALPSVRRTFWGAVWRIPETQYSGFYIQEGGERMRTFISNNKAQEMLKRVGELLLKDPAINKLTCSVEDINDGLDFLKQFVDPSNESSSSNPSIYSETEVYEKIRSALLNQRWQSMTRLELRLHIIRSVYLLRNHSGTLPHDQVDTFLRGITEHRFSHNNTHDYVDNLYKKIIAHKENKLPPREMDLLSREIQFLYEWHWIMTTSLSGGNSTDIVFPWLDPHVDRLSEPDIDTLMNSALQWMQQTNDTRTKNTRVTREEFAEYIVRQLGTSRPPIGYTLFDRFDTLWSWDFLRREGLDPLKDQIRSGDVATMAELETVFKRLIGKSDLTALSPQEQEWLRLLSDRFHTFEAEQKWKFHPNDIFDAAIDRKTALTNYVNLLKEPTMRCVTLAEVWSTAYSNASWSWQPVESIIESDFNTHWNTWIAAKINAITTDFDHDNALDDDVLESVRKILPKTDTWVRETLCTHIRDVLLTVASESDESKVSRPQREKALQILESDLLSGLPKDAKKKLPDLITQQKQAIKDQDTAKEKMQFATELLQLKTTITNDPLADNLVETDEKTLVKPLFVTALEKCDPAQRLDLINHFTAELQKIASDQDMNKRVFREEALWLLETQIMPNLGKTSRWQLQAYITMQRTDIVNQELAQFKTEITLDPLEDKLEAKVSEILDKSESHKYNDIQKADIIDHFWKELKKIASDQNPGKRALREEALGLLETKIMPHLTRTPKGDLGDYIKIQRESIEALERTITRRKENALKLSETLATTLPKGSPEEKKQALLKLTEGDTLTPAQKGIIREFFPEGSTDEVTQNMIDGCVHRLIYATQEIRGIDQIVEGHRLLQADQATLTQINIQLNTAHIAQIEAEVNENVNAHIHRK